MKIRTSRGKPHHSLTVAARGRVGRTRAAIGHLPSENGQTHAQSNSRTIEPRKPHSLVSLARISIARAGQHRQHHVAQHRVARACGVSIDLHRPLKRPTTCTYAMGPPYDSATIKYLRFDCDITKGALRRFGEAAHLLISQCSAMNCSKRSNQLRMRDNKF